jgi:uridine phosphorylase
MGNRSRDRGGRSVVEPRRRRGEGPVPPALILSFTRQDLQIMLQTLGLAQQEGRRIDFADLWSCDGSRCRVGLVGPALGAPAAVLLFERLVALGGRWFVGLGSCGSLQPSLKIGHIVLPTGARSEEGTSVHYRAPGVVTRPDPRMFAEIKQALGSRGRYPAEGEIWTTDAPFRETVYKVRNYQRYGLLGVDMEASALMTVASFREVAFVCILVVSDELGTLRWRQGFRDPRYSKGLAHVTRTTVDFLSQKMGSFAGAPESG